jgi:histidine triad (HIT) family protein
MKECIFCRIIKKEIPADIVYENSRILAFRDINQVAPVHILLIPKKHIATFLDVQEGDMALLGEIQYTAAKIAREMGLEKGFRLVGNCNKDAGQLVFHIHYHLLAGRELGWPPG